MIQQKKSVDLSFQTEQKKTKFVINNIQAKNALQYKICNFAAY